MGSRPVDGEHRSDPTVLLRPHHARGIVGSSEERSARLALLPTCCGGERVTGNPYSILYFIDQRTPQLHQVRRTSTGEQLDGPESYRRRNGSHPHIAGPSNRITPGRTVEATSGPREPRGRRHRSSSARNQVATLYDAITTGHSTGLRIVLSESKDLFITARIGHRGSLLHVTTFLVR